jgi:hypothetical protein
VLAVIHAQFTLLTRIRGETLIPALGLRILDLAKAVLGASGGAKKSAMFSWFEVN